MTGLPNLPRLPSKFCCALQCGVEHVVREILTLLYGIYELVNVFVELVSSVLESSGGELIAIRVTQVSLCSGAVSFPVGWHVTVFPRIIAREFIVKARFDGIVAGYLLQFVVDYCNEVGMVRLGGKVIFYCFWIFGISWNIIEVSKRYYMAAVLNKLD